MKYFITISLITYLDKIPYGIMNYAEFIQEIRYFIDKNSFHRKAGSNKKPGVSPSEKIW